MGRLLYKIHSFTNRLVITNFELNLDVNSFISIQVLSNIIKNFVAKTCSLKIIYKKAHLSILYVKLKKN